MEKSSSSRIFTNFYLPGSGEVLAFKHEIQIPKYETTGDHDMELELDEAVVLKWEIYDGAVRNEKYRRLAEVLGLQNWILTPKYRI